jgi:hypothetical protein
MYQAFVLAMSVGGGGTIFTLFYAVPFKIVPVRLDAVCPAIAPMLETLIGVLYLEFGLQFFLNHDNIKFHPLEFSHQFHESNYI